MLGDELLGNGLPGDGVEAWLGGGEGRGDLAMDMWKKWAATGLSRGSDVEGVGGEVRGGDSDTCEGCEVWRWVGPKGGVEEGESDLTPRVAAVCVGWGAVGVGVGRG